MNRPQNSPQSWMPQQNEQFIEFQNIRGTSLPPLPMGVQVPVPPFSSNID